VSLQKRYITLIFFLLLIFFTAVGAVVTRFQERYVREELIEEGQLLASSLYWAFEQPLARGEEQRLRAMVEEIVGHREMRHLLIYAGGASYGDSGISNAARERYIEAAERAVSGEEAVVTLGSLHRDSLLVAVQVGQDSGRGAQGRAVALVFRPHINPLEQVVSRTVIRGIVGGFLLLVSLSVVSFLFFSRWVVKPLRDVLRQLYSLEAGEYEEPFDVPRQSREFTRLFIALREVRNRLARSSRRLERRGALDAIMKDNARELMAAGGDDIEQAVEQVLRRTMRFLGADAAGIYFLRGENWLYATHYAFDVSPPLRAGTPASPLFNIRREEYPWILRRMLLRKLVVVQDASKLPASRERDREGLLGSGIGSTLLVPFYSEKLQPGALGFWCFDRAQQWDLVSTPGLQRIGEFCVMALLRTSAQMQLLESESRYRQIAENLHEALFLLDEGMKRFLYVSPILSEMLELPMDELYEEPQRWMELIHAADRDVVKGYLREVRAGEATEPMEFRITTPSAEEKWIRLTIMPVRREKGEELRWTGIAEEITQRKKMRLQLARAREQEYEIGERIQRSLLLDEAPETIEGLRIGADTLPSRSIDGDFYHFIDYKDQILDLITGDVMGKGIGAALVGAGVKSGLLQSAVNCFIHAPAGSVPPATEIMKAAAEGLGSSLVELETFVTMSYLRATFTPPVIEFIDCGNTPMLHYRAMDDEVWRTKGSNLPLGFVEEQEYSSYLIPLLPGDVLLLYSDGITEAMNPEGEVFGEERLADFLRMHAEKEPQELIRLLKEKLVFFAGDNQFDDDVTMLFLASDKPGWRTELRELPANREELGTLRAWLQEFFTSGQEELDALMISAVEAFTNILRHSGLPEGSRIRVELGGVAGAAAYVRMDHAGPLFNWQRERPVGDVEQLEEHGYGLELMRRSLDSVHYTRTEERAGVWLVKQRGRGRPE
jgi:PAS domain S-box-containing protein